MIMTPHTIRRLAACCVVLTSLSLTPAAQQKHVPAETTRLIEVLKLGTNSIFRTLKPGGRFAVMDFPPRAPVSGVIAPALRASGDTHGVTIDTVVQELEAAGFRILEIARDWPGQLFLVLAERAR